MKKLILALFLIPFFVVGQPAVSDAQLKKKSRRDNFQAGLDVGSYIFGTIPFASAEFEGSEASFSGSGGMGPIFGAHFNMYAAKNYIIHADVAYSYQSGQAKVDFDDKGLEDQDFDYAMNMFRFSLGLGRTILESRMVMPYWMLGMGLHSMSFRDKDDGETSRGTGVGPWGALGVDGKILRTKGLQIFAGGQLRMDLIYTISPLKSKDTEITMGYLPVQFLITGGIMF